MYKIVSVLCLFLGTFSLSAKCSEVPHSIKDSYASNMYHAFWLQAHGQSTLAQYQFESAYKEAKKAGENILRLIAIEQLFVWYRMYGSSLKLFLKKPTGNDQIYGEYKPHLSIASGNSIPFESEWGKTPEQAVQIRNFMFGVGEVIAGIFCATVTSGWGTTIAAGLIYNGCDRIYTSLNNIWAQHQAMIALKNWEQGALKTAQEQD